MSQTSSKLSPESVAISAASADAVCVTERANLALIGFARGDTCAIDPCPTMHRALSVGEETRTK
jgi:hypothetical protein